MRLLEPSGEIRSKIQTIQWSANSASLAGGSKHLTSTKHQRGGSSTCLFFPWTWPINQKNAQNMLKNLKQCLKAPSQIWEILRSVDFRETKKKTPRTSLSRAFSRRQLLTGGRAELIVGDWDLRDVAGVQFLHEIRSHWVLAAWGATGWNFLRYLCEEFLEWWSDQWHVFLGGWGELKMNGSYSYQNARML